MTDDQRKEMVAALLAALLLIYRGRVRQVLNVLGITAASVAISDAAYERLKAFVDDRAALVQEGINQRIQQTLAELPADATAVQQQSAIAHLRQEFDHYHNTVLVPFLIRYARQQATLDTYRNTRAADTNLAGADSGESGAASTMSAADAVPWIWTQYTDFEDECQEAAAASPASLDELLAITGDPPPIHTRCGCSLNPAS